MENSHDYRFGHLEADIKYIKEALDGFKDGIAHTLEDHGNRITKMEHKHTALASVSAFVGAIVAFLGTIIVDPLKDVF